MGIRAAEFEGLKLRMNEVSAFRWCQVGLDSFTSSFRPCNLMLSIYEVCLGLSVADAVVGS